MYDAFGKKILDQKVGLALQEMKAQSYIFNGELVEKYSTILLRFDTWISIFLDDGVLFIREENIKEERIVADGDTIEYPIFGLNIGNPGFNKFINLKLISFTIPENIFELRLNFEKNNSLTIFQNELRNGFFGETLIENDKESS